MSKKLDHFFFLKKSDLELDLHNPFKVISESSDMDLAS